MSYLQRNSKYFSFCYSPQKFLIKTHFDRNSKNFFLSLNKPKYSSHNERTTHRELRIELRKQSTPSVLTGNSEGYVVGTGGHNQGLAGAAIGRDVKLVVLVSVVVEHVITCRPAVYMG